MRALFLSFFLFVSLLCQGRDTHTLLPGNVLTRGFFSESFVVTARLVFRPGTVSENSALSGDAASSDRTAGFFMAGPGYAGLKMTAGPGGVRLDYVTEAGHDGDSLTVVPYRNPADGSGSAGPEMMLWVRLNVQQKPDERLRAATQCRFSYSLDGMHYTATGRSFRTAAVVGGAVYGFFCGDPEDCRLDIPELIEAERFLPLGDFRYEESEVPEFELPDPLVGRNGRRVKNVRQWERRRRPELAGLFEREMFGYAPGRPEEFHCRVLTVDPSAFGGLATRKEVGVYLSADERAYLRLRLYVPNDRKGPVPAFLGPNFFGNHTTTDDPGVALGDTLRYGADRVWHPRGYHARRWPYEEILRRGYAVATFCCADVDPDFDDGFRNGVHGVFDPAGFSAGKSCRAVAAVRPAPAPWGREELAALTADRDSSAWGAIAAWAWGLSRALDYLETDPDVAGDRVVVIGHSRLGKTALWAGAIDPRFAMVISNNSGCGGAALSRRGFGETVRRINTHFPHWFCKRFHAYNDREEELPFDQHELLALIAPRPLYVASATEDRWSDPHGEYLSLLAAGPVYALYGANDRTGYHIRPGRHDIVLYDWERYLDFADRFLR